MKKSLLYFGCIDGVGHHLWLSPYRIVDFNTVRAELMPAVNRDLIQHVDGLFTPDYDNNINHGLYNESIIPPVRIVAWWDHSVDKRPGSNSALIGYGYDSAEEIIAAAYELFPAVMNRQRRPVKYEYGR